MLTIPISQELEDRLGELAAQTGKTKEVVARMAIIEWIEDYEDTVIALERLEKSTKRIPLAEVEKQIFRNSMLET